MRGRTELPRTRRAGWRVSEETKQGEFGVYGSRNPEASWVDVKTVAAAVRVDIKHAQKLSSDDPMRLPVCIKVSVKISRYAGGQSLHLKISECPGVKVTNPAWALHAAVFPHTRQEQHVHRFTKEASRVLEALERITGMYNFDKSDVESDYFNTAFYVHVDFTSELERADVVSPELVSAAKASLQAVETLEGRGFHALVVVTTSTTEPNENDEVGSEGQDGQSRLEPPLNYSASAFVDALRRTTKGKS